MALTPPPSACTAPQAPRNGKLTIKIKKTGAPKGDANNTSPTTSDTEGAPPEPPAVPQGAGLGADQEEGRRLPPQLASLGPSCHSSVSGTHRALSTSSPTAVAAVGGPGPAVGGGGSGAEVGGGLAYMLGCVCCRR